MIEKEPVPELRPATRLPWVLIGLAIVVGVVVTARTCRRANGGSAAGSGNTAVSSSDDTGKPTGPTDAGSQPAAVPESGRGQESAQAAQDPKVLVASGDLVAAREEALKSLSTAVGEERNALELIIGQINTNLVFSPAVMPGKTNHVIQSGESLEAIAKKYRTTVELIQAGNGISNPSRIRKGDTLRVLTGAFSIEVQRESRSLLVYHDGRFFKRYTVGTGRHDKTPLGSFTIVDRIKEPVWWRPDGNQIPYGNPENILGTRWLALKASGDTADVKGYGIHGTWDDGSIGKAESAGCIRMHNSDVEELFVLVPNGTEVRIVDK